MAPPKSMKDWAKRSIVGLAEIVTPDARWPELGAQAWLPKCRGAVHCVTAGHNRRSFSDHYLRSVACLVAGTA
jgi:hypothetical protein